MLRIKFIFIAITLNLIGLCGCSSNTTYVCPFGIGYLTPNDYETMQDAGLISDEFATWLLETNMYCEENA